MYRNSYCSSKVDFFFPLYFWFLIILVGFIFQKKGVSVLDSDGRGTWHCSVFCINKEKN